MKPDISHHDHIKALVDRFYVKVRENETLGYIFNDIARVNWDQHLPVMYAFWAGVLLGAQSYQGNPMLKHIALSKITPLTQSEFSTWISLFHETVDELFEGEIANSAKSRAEQIAMLMLHKIQMDG